MKYSWIAVALATAIRLYAGAQPWVVAVVVVLATFAAVASGRVFRSSRPKEAKPPDDSKTLRLASLFLLAAAIVDVASLWRLHVTSRDFPKRAALHVTEDVARIR